MSSPLSSAPSSPLSSVPASPAPATTPAAMAEIDQPLTYGIRIASMNVNDARHFLTAWVPLVQRYRASVDILNNHPSQLGDNEEYAEVVIAEELKAIRANYLDIAEDLASKDFSIADRVSSTLCVFEECINDIDRFSSQVRARTARMGSFQEEYSRVKMRIAYHARIHPELEESLRNMVREMDEKAEVLFRAGVRLKDREWYAGCQDLLAEWHKIVPPSRRIAKMIGLRWARRIVLERGASVPDHDDNDDDDDHGDGDGEGSEDSEKDEPTMRNGAEDGAEDGA